SSRAADSYRRAPSSVSTSTPRARASSSGFPAATTRPARRMTTRSQTSSISLRRWELRRTPTPRPRSSSSSSRTVRRPTGSSARRRRAGRSAAHGRRAGGRADEPARDLGERGLSGAVRAEQPDELALLDLEVDAAQGLDGAVALRETADGEGGRQAG